MHFMHLLRCLEWLVIFFNLSFQKVCVHHACKFLQTHVHLTYRRTSLKSAVQEITNKIYVNPGDE